MNHVPPNTLLASTQRRSPSCGHRILLDKPTPLDHSQKSLLFVALIVAAFIIATVILTSCYTESHSYLRLP